MLKTTGSKILAVLLLLSFICTGCGASQANTHGLDAKNPVLITIWHYYNGAQKIAFDQMVKEFNETVGVKEGIIVESYSHGNVNSLIGKVMDAAQKKVGAEKMPDIFAAYADAAYAIDQMGLVADLSPYISKNDLNTYVDSYVEEGRINSDQQLKIFPTAKSTEVLLVNQTDWNKFAHATGAQTTCFDTIEGITQVAADYYRWTDSLTPAPDDGKAFFGRDALANYILIGSKQLGTEIFAVDKGKVTLHLDQAVMRQLWDNYYVPMLRGHFAADGRFRSDDAKTGTIIALVGSSSGSAYFPDQVTIDDQAPYPIEMAVYPVPCFVKGEHYAVQQGAGMVVTKSDETHEYAASVFLQWFTDSDRNIAFSASSGYLPVKKEANDAARLNKQLDATSGNSAVGAQLRAVLPVALEVINSHTLYTNKAFPQGTAARDILEQAFTKQLAIDLPVVHEKMAAGLSREEAVQPFVTDQHFQAWYTHLDQTLKGTIQ